METKEFQDSGNIPAPVSLKQQFTNSKAEFVAPANAWNDITQFSAWNEVNPPNRQAAAKESPGGEGESRSWQSQFTPQPWRPEYKGQANLHIFEDWCGSSTLQLRKNLHFPLYPHSRTTVKKLAVAPRWTNYGLRIFGYLHPYEDGEYLFAVASDDNSEFWLSLDDSPLSLRLLALVGKTGTEWAAPGEFGKYASQTSEPIELTTSKRYYFEILHKQNDKGTDHVEVAWRLLQDGQRFTVINSQYISLYTNESALMMSEVTHIPQSAASHTEPPRDAPGHPSLGADMLREDPRDSLYQVPLVDSVHLHHVLPDCSYKPTYIIKGFPLLRYQGLQFVHMSYVYPNDYTRLTHMESDNKCFYHENPRYLDRFGFFKYMKMDIPENEGFEDRERFWDKQDFGLQENISLDEIFQYEDPEVKDSKLGMNVEDAQDRSNKLPDYGDDYDDYTFKRRRKLFSMPLATRPVPLRKRKRRAKARAQGARAGPTQASDAGQKAEPLNGAGNREKPDGEGRSHPSEELKLSRADPLQGKNASGTADGREGEAPGTQEAEAEQPNGVKTQSFRPVLAQTAPPTIQEDKTTARASLVLEEDRLKSSLRRGEATDPQSASTQRRRAARRKSWRESEADPPTATRSAQGGEEEAALEPLGAAESEAGSDRLWALEGDSEVDRDSEGTFELTKPPVFDQAVNWEQTFDVEPLDFHTLRSDWIDLTCNVSGNLLLGPRDAQAVVESFMKKLNLKNQGRFSLLRAVNVEKRSDGSQGSRYLLELELQQEGVGRVRLSSYIYALQRRGGRRAHRAPPQQESLLCTPLGFAWDPAATVHFIVPVKNQARWVQQFITDMEQLYRHTEDRNLNVIITDYSSTDMDVERALQNSALPRYQYLKLNGNFERSAGLQAGINLITDDHSIVFLCDLHIHFPPFIIDSIRKHCVEGKMAFAPIVMRLGCGATPLEPNGFWEVNGFGLLGIYKSDLDAAGGMNTRDFRDRWGGEDWELLDRILQAGLEVERIHLRNFMHHYHSKRGMWNRQPLRPT
ncbi:hypothetical protein AAFF_G00172320 [Aldrovandia affinis]|uniref:Beta-1,4-N-acetylgalactosaminyltransferase n=1 Tax=Aldrovandia affinis TaxID=143900 RepID=A0AAD7SYP5_9TELE|nr:hypothetical protein AAFF_G00172320 [Aldrovandia affinis]